MTILIKILQFIMALSILIILHELGHFIAAKSFKTRVDKFYLFFDWGFSLFRIKKVNGKWRFRLFAKNVPSKYDVVETKLLNGKKSVDYRPIDLDTLPEDDWRRSDSTEYGIGWFPVGGYNKIAGMIDESMDKEQMKQAPQKWEFRSKPAWQRFIIMIGGVFMNVVLAFAIYIGLLSHYGEQYLSTAEVNKYGIHVDSVGYAFGLRDGDKILSVDGQYIDNFSEIPLTIVLEGSKTIEVERNGQRQVVTLPDDAVAQILRNQKSSFISFRTPFVVYDFADQSVAKTAGMEKGDRIVALNDISTPYYQDFIQRIKDFKNQDITVTGIRHSDTLRFAMHLSDAAVIGVYMNPIDSCFNISTKDYTFVQAIPAGFSKTVSELSGYWKQLKLIIKPGTKAYESVGGFISIGKIFPDHFNWRSFWSLTAFLSIALAIMNILPIPALDGGHILFLLYEIITRRKPSDRFMEIAVNIGLILVLALLIFANGNDIIRLFR